MTKIKVSRKDVAGNINKASDTILNIDSYTPLSWEELKNLSAKSPHWKWTREYCVEKLMTLLANKMGKGFGDNVELNRETFLKLLNDLDFVSLHTSACIAPGFHHSHNNWYVETSIDSKRWYELDLCVFGPTFEDLVKMFPIINSGSTQMVFDLGNGKCLKWFDYVHAPTDTFNIPKSIQPLWYPCSWVLLEDSIEDTNTFCRIQDILTPLGRHNEYGKEIEKRVKEAHLVSGIDIKLLQDSCKDLAYDFGFSNCLEWGRDASGQLWIFDLH